MRCYECNGSLVKQTGSVTFNDTFVGKYSVDNISYLKCDCCGELAFPAGVSTVIDGAKKNKLQRLIGRLPVSEFITATEVASILGISRQAVHKHRRISRGFVHTFMNGAKILYHKKSVELFRDTGDGRFSLVGYGTGASWGVYRVIDGERKKMTVPQDWEIEKVNSLDSHLEEGLG
ncbi:MAG: helix-turn-helix domain-containing protein [Proteobacteria bacterium]|nr:helix-turn-helix domain-containing protein [Pseudomonadota bacterium]MBU1716119.1 helix-turn-helix domain-containing protein [Pseudomonadota bacterium]